MTLEDLKKLAESATSGPWRYLPENESNHACIQGPELPDAICCWRFVSPQEQRNAAFIAASRTYVPLLIAVAEAALAHVYALDNQMIHDDHPLFDERAAEAVAQREEVRRALKALHSPEGAR